LSLEGRSAVRRRPTPLLLPCGHAQGSIAPGTTDPPHTCDGRWRAAAPATGRAAARHYSL